MKTISIGISTCPNDTFIYQALYEGKVDAPCKLEFEFADVQTLNERVIAGTLDMAKVSCAVVDFIKDKYTVLSSGGAAGFGCGPLLLSNEKSFNENEPVYLPGEHTTATMLFKYYVQTVRARGILPQSLRLEYMRFDELYKKLCSKEIVQGVTIHEHRFTYKRDNLNLIADLGEYWEREKKAPIPLGCTVIKKEFGEEFALEMDLCVQKSLRLAWDREEPITDFIRELAQIDDDDVILQHIKMFVNEYSMKRFSW